MKRIINILLIICATSLIAQTPTGSIKGKVIDNGTKEPLVGVNVIILKTNLGAATDQNGEFVIHSVPVGGYSIAFHYIGYEKVVKPDVMVRPNRITFSHAGLKMSIVQGEQITVTAGYFQKNENEPVSVYSFNAEEIRRSPGSAGDVSRILLALPSAARVTDNANDLMVRGGSPIENGYYIDHIPIPNINHYPAMGSTGGPIGALNVDFIDDVKFLTGGFGAIYGDRLSSIIDIQFREGNREELDSQIDMNMAGFGGILEGPFADQRGSWLISARKSYLDLLVDAIGTGVAPRYGDIQMKMTYDLNARNKLTFIDIFADNRISFGRDNSIEMGDPTYGKYKGQQNTIGLNWRSLWHKGGYSNLSLSYSHQKSTDSFFDTHDQRMFVDNDSREGVFHLRNTNHYRIDNDKKIEFGLNLSYDNSRYKYYLAADTMVYVVDAQVDTMLREAISVDRRFSAHKTGLYFTYIWNPLSKLTMSMGLRGDYFSYNKQFQLSPRFSIAYQVNDLFSVNFATGIYYQQLPFYLLTQNEANKDLAVPRATHYVLGFDYMLRHDTQLTVELYSKDYSDFPLTHDDPGSFVVDDGTSMSHFMNYDLTGGGKAYTRGIELLLQKKLAQNFYGLVSASVFRSKYRDLFGKWRNRNFDNRYLFSVIGGYKPNNKWEFSVRWNIAGGVPYTPLNVESLNATGLNIVDSQNINSKRYPDYHSLNIRFDRRFHFRGSSIVAFLSLWNVYNRKNIAGYFWNEIDKKEDVYYQWTFMPIGGFEYEF